MHGRHARADRGCRDREVGDHEEGGHDARPMCRGQHRRECAQRSHEGGAEAEADQHAAEEKAVERPARDRGRGDDAADGEQSRAADDRRAVGGVAQDPLCQHGAHGEDEHERAADRVVVRRVQLPDDRRAEREVEPSHRPGRQHAEGREAERAPERTRHLRHARRQADAPAARRHGLGKPPRGPRAEAREHCDDDERRDLGIARVLHEQAREQRAEADPAGAHDAVDQARLAAIATGVQIDERRSGRTQQQPGRETLQRARDVEPVEASRDHEDRLGADQREQRAHDHGATSDQVGEPAGQEQREQHADRVDRVHLGHGERREAPLGCVDRVERRRCRRRHQREHDEASNDREGVPESSHTRNRRLASVY